MPFYYYYENYLGHEPTKTDDIGSGVTIIEAANADAANARFLTLTGATFEARWDIRNRWQAPQWHPVRDSDNEEHLRWDENTGCTRVYPAIDTWDHNPSQTLVIHYLNGTRASYTMTDLPENWRVLHQSSVAGFVPRLDDFYVDPNGVMGGVFFEAMSDGRHPDDDDDDDDYDNYYDDLLELAAHEMIEQAEFDPLIEADASEEF